MTTLIDIMLNLGVVIFLGLVTFRAKALDLYGVAIAVPIGFVIVLAGGWAWLVILVVFFITASFFTKFRYNYKRSLGYTQEKNGARGWPNTLANGLIPTIAAIAEFYTHSTVFVALFIGAIATSTADTLATEVGMLSKVNPRLITNIRKKVVAGTSGGVTPLGYLMCIVGSTLIGFLAVFLRIGGTESYKFLVICIFSGFVGSTVDSILGATIQGMYCCTVCHSFSESCEHHGVPSTRIRGIKFVGNNVVNLVSVIVGALTALVLLQII